MKFHLIKTAEWPSVVKGTDDISAACGVVIPKAVFAFVMSGTIGVSKITTCKECIEKVQAIKIEGQYYVSGIVPGQEAKTEAVCHD